LSLPLFVYGTLMRGGAQAGLVGPARRGPATTRGRLWRMPEGYPALSDGDHLVHGEWVEPVSSDVLARLDAYEGVDEGLYARRVIRVQAEDGTFDAWAWVMADPPRRGGVAIPSGRWRASSLG
jgi:gamma-glutamylcyclotransferase (GGCT)/AIG2-like uncharacterized protein YtfP